MLSQLSIVSCIAALSGETFSAPTVERATAANTSQGSFTYYDLQTPLAGPCDLTTGPDGAIWADTFLANKIVRVDRNTGELNEYDIPYTLPVLGNSVLPSDAQGRVALACVIQPGKDGNLYAAAGVRNQFVRINPTTKEIDVFDSRNPLGNLQPFNDAWPGETGMFFSQTSGNVITLFDYATTQQTNFEVPTPAAGPLGMKIASDGALWFTEFFAGKIGRLNATTGKIQEYNLPPNLATPAVMRAETEGGNLWFTALGLNALGRINVYTGEIQAYEDDIPGSFPTEDDVDGQGNVWFSTISQNQLNYLTPSTGEFSHIPQPDGQVATASLGLPPAADVAMHYVAEDNTMWFTELANDRIGRYQI